MITQPPNYYSQLKIGHFTVVCLVTWPLNTSEAGRDLLFIQTSLFFSFKCQLVSMKNNLLTTTKALSSVSK